MWIINKIKSLFRKGKDESAIYPEGTCGSCVHYKDGMCKIPRKTKTKTETFNPVLSELNKRQGLNRAEPTYGVAKFPESKCSMRRGEYINKYKKQS